jgi:hypothetical protein
MSSLLCFVYLYRNRLPYGMLYTRTPHNARSALSNVCQVIESKQNLSNYHPHARYFVRFLVRSSSTLQKMRRKHGKSRGEKVNRESFRLCPSVISTLFGPVFARLGFKLWMDEIIKTSHPSTASYNQAIALLNSIVLIHWST